MRVPRSPKFQVTTQVAVTTIIRKCTQLQQLMYDWEHEDINETSAVTKAREVHKTIGKMLTVLENEE